MLAKSAVMLNTAVTNQPQVQVDEGLQECRDGWYAASAALKDTIDPFVKEVTDLGAFERRGGVNDSAELGKKALDAVETVHKYEQALMKVQKELTAKLCQLGKAAQACERPLAEYQVRLESMPPACR
jgi:hypothetical protein